MHIDNYYKEQRNGIMIIHTDFKHIFSSFMEYTSTG